MHALAPGVTATHDVLVERLETAASRRASPSRPRDHYPATDTFLASASRHNAAVNAVLVPRARRQLPDGKERARDFVHQSRRLEVALGQVKAKLYGSTYSIRRRWPDVWDDVRRELEATWELERSLAIDLDAAADPGDDTGDDTGEDAAAGELLYRAELRAPTRPHPYVPHRGAMGRIARAICVQVDHFWDTTEGRMIPEPVRHHDRDHDGLLTQYLLADPHLGDD
ncbi:hypothetical protein [Nocardioides sp.]|uniref:hypothetical protein n=1 Tax=Nocardioides sp. TaxID=35761 RepID=UPI002734873D|nr:hypothetical protein [Nocardioides sp.]MDP3890319.1 hypothetical protein [Nocardioides sp.]